jgi:hypothetical protein
VTISGQLTVGGSPLPGATVTLSGSQSGTTTTDANGNWRFVVAAGSYTITPSAAGYSFSPPAVTFNNLLASQVASFQVARVPTLFLSINDTAGTSDDIAVLNPPQAIPAQVLLVGASGTVQLSAAPAGRVAISPTTLSLASGVPAEVTITPLQQSQAAEDVQITATFGTVTATGNMTVVNVVFPAIRNADTPAGMPDRIPPGVDTPVQVIVQPDLTGSGQSVTLGKRVAGGNSGNFTIGGGINQTITTTTTVNLRRPRVPGADILDNCNWLRMWDTRMPPLVTDSALPRSH